MLKISGTEKEVREFINENLDCLGCPNGLYHSDDYCCEDKNCDDCFLENEKRFIFIIENEKGE